MILDTDKIQCDRAYRDELRHRCETDHFFLAEMVGLTAFVPRIHEPVRQFYFPKNRNLSIPEQHRKKFRLHLDPRGTYKTTFGRVDLLQWVLAFPETVTILNISATQPLAAAIGENIAVYLWRRKGHPATQLQLLYPELCVERRPGGTWSTSVRELGQLDATIDYTSPESQQSGWHPWILSPDDMVDTLNSGIKAKAEVRRGVVDNYDTNRNTRRPGGYVYMRGTRYHPMDLYGVELERMDPEQWEVLIRSAITVCSGKRLLPGEFPDEDDCILNFPEMPEVGEYRFLRQLYLEAFETFMCQQQNDPQGGHIPDFDEALYKTMLIPPERIPPLGESFLCWRFRYGGKTYMNKDEGVAARILDGKVYVTDAWSGSYTPSRLGEKIVREAKRQQTSVVILEDLPGVQFMEAEIRNESMRRNYPIRIHWVAYEEEDSYRYERIRAIEPQARAGQILVSTATGAAAEFRKQLLNFRLIPENGLVDCVSRLAEKIPLVQFRQDIQDEESELQLSRRNSLHWQTVFGQPGGGTTALEERKAMEAAASAAAWSSVNHLGLRDILGGLDG